MNQKSPQLQRRILSPRQCKNRVAETTAAEEPIVNNNGSARRKLNLQEGNTNGKSRRKIDITVEVVIL